MRKKLLLLSFLVFNLVAVAQSINVNTTTYTVPQLVKEKLFNLAPGQSSNSCTGSISNITWSTGTNFGSTNGIGYFTNTNPNFPLSAGVILSTGSATAAAGPNSSIQSNGSTAWDGDTQLENVILAATGNAMNSQNATILEFDFVPLTNTMSFDFVFASDEYGTFQCSYSDAFAFFLTNVTAGTPATNLALVPNTTTPISVVTVRNQLYNTSCASVNQQYFGNYYQLPQGLNPANAPTNFNGNTVVMTASSSVIPNNTYHLKLVIADRSDTAYDSAVFLGAGSFNFPILTGGFGGTGFYVADGTAICYGGSRTVSAESTPTPGAVYSWSVGGNPIPNSNSNNYTITQPGVYTANITTGTNTQSSCPFTVEFLPPMPIGTPTDLTNPTSNPIFNFTGNLNTILNGNSSNDYEVNFHHTLADAQNVANPISNFSNYTGYDGEVIYVSIQDLVSGASCIETRSFILHLNTVAITPTTPPDLTELDDSSNDGIAPFNLTPQTSIVLGSYDPTLYTVTYYTSLSDATAGTNPITVLNPFDGINNQEIYVRVTENALPTNFGTTSFTLFVIANPVVTLSASSTNICSYQNTVITATVNNPGNYNYTWTVPTGVTNPGNVSSFPTNIAGNYSVIVTDTTTGGVSVPAFIDIVVNTPPTPITPTAYHVCDDNTDGYATFTLSTKDAEITGGNTNYTVTYHVTQPAADAGTPVLPNSYSNNIANSQTVYVRVVDNTTGCYATTTLQLVVDQKPQVTTSSAGVCIGNNATVSTTVSPAGTYNYVWTYPSGASDPGNVSTFTTSVAGTYTVVATNTTTGCSSNATPVTVTIYPLPVVVTPNPMTMCSNGSSNQAIFNLPLNDSAITNGASGVTVTYYNSQADADAETNAITPSNAYLGTHGETVYVRVENNLTSCYATTTLLLQVTQGPVANTPSPLERCDDNNDGYNIFTLSNATAQIVGGSLPPGVSVSYHLTQDDATLGANPLGNSYSNNTPWTQTIYVRVYYTLTGCANYVQLQLIVHPSPEATIPSDYHACDDNADGVTAFNLSTKINEILGSINPATHTVHFYTDQPSAEAGATNYISNVTNYFNTTPNTQTLWVRVENIATGCYDVVPLVLVVDPLPIVLTPHYQQFEMCDYTGAVGFENFDLNSQVPYILQGQTGMQVDFYPSYTDAVNNTNVITNTASYQNLYPYVHTLGIRVTNTTTGCYSISTMDLYVNELPSPVAPTQPLAVCDTDQNNWAIFNLCDPTFLSTIQQGENYILTFHATIPDAQLGLNQLPCQYNNNNAAVQIIYIRAEDPDTGCYSIVPLELNAHPKPYMPVLTNLEVCDYIGNTQDGYAYFNLSLQTPAILAANTPSSNYTVTYYNNQINASASPNGILPISQITNYFGHNGDTIWVRVQNNSTGCFTVSSFQLIVHAPLVLTTPTLYKVCDTDATPNDNYTSFNILSFIGPIAGYTINLYADAAHTQPISSPFTNTLPANQTIFWTATNNTTGCISSRTLTLTVLPVPTPNTNLSAPQYLIHSCDSNSPNDGFEIFNLTVNANYILNGDTNTELHYYPSLVDAENGTNEITNPTAANVNGDVYIRVQWKPAPVTSFIDSNNQYCHVIVKQPVKVYPLPLMYANKQFQICDNDTDGFAVFDLTSYTDDLLMNTTGITLANTTFVFSNASGVISNPAAYTNTTNPETITVTATSSASPLNCSYTQTFSIIVNPNPTVTPPATWKTCDTLDPTDTVNYPNDGYYNHDLTALIPGILNGQVATDFTVTFYHTEADAIAATNGITNLSAYMAQTETIWIRVTNNTTGCYVVGSTNFVVEQLPEPVIESDNGMHVICVDYRSLMVLRPLQLQIHNLTEDTPYLHGTPTYTYQWYEGNAPILGETNSTYDVPPSATGDVRNYKVEMTTTTPGLGCSYTSVQAFTVIQSGPATPTVIGSTGYTVTNAFTENQTITVDVDGWGKYEYSLDDGPRQTSPIFENVSLGEHFITVWDIKAGNESCDPFLIQKVRTIDYPHYFTPNGDGFNDYWNINGLQGQYAKIYLFDRFGKLIKQLSPDTQGWDGTYNGNPLPATDYWFTVEYFELNTIKTFKAHFSLKR